MAKKQTRRSISVSRGTYERLKAYCETNQISMSQFVERRVGDFLGRSGANQAPAASVPSAPQRAAAPHPAVQPQVPRDAFEVPAQPAAEPAQPQAASPITTPSPTRVSQMNQPISQPVAASEPVVKRSDDEPLVKDPDANLTADQIFTF